MITTEQLTTFRTTLLPLIGTQLPVLTIPEELLMIFEPSQVGTIVGTLVDACLPRLELLFPNKNSLKSMGLQRASGIFGDREGYPDFVHESGFRVELKLLYKDPVDIKMKTPVTKREPSARLSQKVTIKNVDPDHDILLVLVYQLQPQFENVTEIFYSPTIIDIGTFSMIEAINARDHRLLSRGGIWFGDYEVPTILSRIGARKLAKGQLPNRTVYGRKESEGYDYNEDTNFGKLKRIPLEPLQEFLRIHGS